MISTRALSLWILALIFGLLITRLVSGEEGGNQDQKLPGIPKGVRLGMNVKYLMKVRPHVKRFDLNAALESKTKTVNLNKGSYLLIEEIVNSVRYSKIVIYGIKKGRCVSLGWEETYSVHDEPAILSKTKGRRQSFAQKRTQIIRKFVALLGTKYKKKLMRKDFRDFSCLAPVFLWEGDKQIVALTVTSEYPGVTLAKGSIQVNVWKRGNKESRLEFEKNVERKLVDELFFPLLKEIRQ